MEATTSVWRVRDFRTWVVGTSADSLGGSIVTLAIPLMALHVSGSSTLAGLAGTAYALGFASLVLLGGVLVDRVDRRTCMRWGSGLRLLLWGSCGALAATGALSPAAFVLVVTAAGIARGLFGTADNAALRSIVPRSSLPRAQAVIQSREALVELAGPPLGGALFGLAAGAPFWAAGGLAAILLCCTWLIRTDLAVQRADVVDDAAAPTTAARRLGRDLRDGWTFVMADALLRSVAVLVLLVNFAVGLLLHVATIHFAASGVPAVQLSLLYVAAAVAVLLGAVAAGPIVARVAGGRVIVGSLATIAIALGLAAWLPQLATMFAWLFVIGLVVPIVTTVLQGYAAWRTPPELQGRVMSLLSLASLGSVAFAPLVAGLVVAGDLVVLALAGAAAIAVLATVLACVTRSVRTLGTPEAWREEGA